MMFSLYLFLFCTLNVDAFAPAPSRRTPFAQDPVAGALNPARSLSTVLFSKEPLETEGDWAAFLDVDGTGLVYYFNDNTGESMWEPPTETFPEVTLTGRMRRRARAQQLEYVKASALQEGQDPKKGFLASLLGEDEVKEVLEMPKEEPEEDNWFGALFAERNERQKEGKEQPTETSQEGFAGGFFNNLFTSTSDADVESTPVPTASETETEVTPAVAEEVLEPVIEQPVEEPVVEPIKLDMASYVLPHPAKILWGGEDAVFTKGRTFGVMDGVSGAEKQVGVPLYSKVLAKELKQTIGEDSLDVRELTSKLAAAAETADQTATGASTAILASISTDGFLRVLNVGDSTCIVVRNGKVAGKSREITHYFDCPYQLSVDSPDRPRDGTRKNLELLQGDLILMASDGVFDNMNDNEIAEMAAAGPKQSSAIAKRVCEQARKVSANTKSETPYAKMAKKYGDPAYSDGLGGKLDDVSCVVVRYGE